MPSLLVLVLGAVVCFVFLPKMTPYILGVLALAMFIVGAWQHYQMFPYEYRSSVLIDLLRDYSPFVMLLAVIGGGLVALSLAFGVSPPSVAEVLPAAITDIIPAINNTKTNNAKNNGGIMNVFNAPKANNAKPANNLAALNPFNTKVNNATKPNNAKRNNLASPSFKTV